MKPRIKQIAGRAGRFGIFEEGIVMAMQDGEHIRRGLAATPEQITIAYLGFPEILALGAAIGTPAAEIRVRAYSFDGIRTATVSSPPVTVAGMQSRFGSTTVSGPGINAEARRLKVSFV